LRYRSAVATAVLQQRKRSALIYRAKCSGTQNALLCSAFLSFVSKGSTMKNLACSGTSSYPLCCFTNSISDSGGVITTGSHTKDSGRGIAVVSVSRSF
jgi:hypothetical protein